MFYAMKHNIALVIMILVVGYGFGQQVARGQDMPPKDVQAKFFTDFPNSVGYEWSRKGAFYFVKFTNKGLRMTAKYTLTGSWKHTDIELTKSELPQVTLDHLNQNYPGYLIKQILYHDAMEAKYYLVDIQRGGARKTLKYNENGNFWQ